MFIYPRFSHAKAAVFDGWASVGSANLDRLSLIKMVAREGNGFALLMKRLDKSRFQWPASLPLSVVAADE